MNPTSTTQRIQRMSRGFTLVELMVVLSILALIASVTLANLNEARHKAFEGRALADLAQFEQAIELLRQDTGLHPSGYAPPPADCYANNEAYLDSCEAGIQCNDGSFSNWNGPYLDNVPKDPWGTNYFFDPDYKCGLETTGCNTDHWVRAIISMGPDKSVTYNNGDDIVHVLCIGPASI